MIDKYEDVGLRAKIEGVAQFDRAAKQVNMQMNQLGKESVNAANKTGKLTEAFKGMVKPMIAVGAAMAGAFAARAVTQGIASMVQKASDLNESINKVAVVFGDAAESVLEWSKTTATAIGQSRREALEAVGTFGNLFKTMGMGQDEAAEMSMNIAKLASDLASFNNIDPTIALEKLRSGLVGEVEPLRALGILLSETAVKEKAMEMGFEEVSGRLTESAKVQARYALIMEQSVDAQGDFIRTSGDMANASRIIRAALDDLQTEIGKELLPVVADLVGKIKDELPGAMTKARPVIEGFGEAIWGLYKAMEAVGESISRLAGWVQWAENNIFKPITRWMLELQERLGTISVAGQRALDEIRFPKDRLVREAEEAGRGMANAINQSVEEMKRDLESVPYVVSSRLWAMGQMWGMVANEVEDFGTAVVDATYDAADGVGYLRDHISYLRDEIRDLEADLRDAQQAMMDFADPRLIGMQAMEDELFELDMAIKRARLEELGLGEEAAKAAKKVEESAERMVSGFDELAAQQRELAEGIPVPLQRYYWELEQAQREAERAVREAIEPAREDEESEVQRLRRLREAKELMYDLTYQPLLRRLRETFEDLTGANKEITFQAAMAGLKQSWETSEKLTRELEEQRVALDAQEVNLKNLEDAASRLKETRSEQKTLEQEIKEELQEQLRIVTQLLAVSRRAPVRVPTEWEEWGEPGLQTGGRVLKGGAVMVGERGPERAVLPAGTTVLPGGATPAQVSRSYTDNWNITQARETIDVMNEIRKYNAFRRILGGR